MTFEEEQNLLKQTATELLLYVHQRQESYHIRNLSGKLDVSNENVKKLLMLYDLLGIDKAKISEKLKNLLKKVVPVVESETYLKDGNDYFKESLQIVTDERKCKKCGKSLQNTNSKARFCSSSCRVKDYRTKQNVPL